MFKPTYLYIKTHNITGLKYFGKTTAKDPYKYKGSGTRWKRHLNKHGNDVSTEIIGYYTIKEECLDAAINFSKENNIVKSKEWANLKEESLDGGFEYINQSGLNNSKENYKKASESSKLKYNTDILHQERVRSLLLENVKKLHKENKISSVWKKGDPLQKRATELSKTTIAREKQKEAFKQINHQQGEKNSQYGTTWIWCKEEGNKKIKKELLQEYLDKGWEKKYIPGYRTN